MEKNIPGFVCVMTTDAPITSVKKILRFDTYEEAVGTLMSWLESYIPTQFSFSLSGYWNYICERISRRGVLFPENKIENIIIGKDSDGYIDICGIEDGNNYPDIYIYENAFLITAEWIRLTGEIVK